MKASWAELVGTYILVFAECGAVLAGLFYSKIIEED